MSSNPPGSSSSGPSTAPRITRTSDSVAPREPRSILLRTLGAVVLAEQQGSYVIGALDNVMIVVWRSQVRPEALEKLQRSIEWMVAKCPDGRSSVHIVLEGTPLPSPETQQGLIELMRHSNASCGAAVYLGSGFWASALRSNTTQMTMQAQLAPEFRHYQSLEDLVTWMPDKHHELTGVRLRPERLLSATRAFVAMT